MGVVKGVVHIFPTTQLLCYSFRTTTASSIRPAKGFNAALTELWIRWNVGIIFLPVLAGSWNNGSPSFSPLSRVPSRISKSLLPSHKFKGGRYVVLEKDDDDIMDRKTDLCSSAGKGGIRKTTFEHCQMETVEIYWAWAEKRGRYGEEHLAVWDGRERARGRQRLKMLDWMMERLRVRDRKQLGNVAMDRKRWRERGPPWSVYSIWCQDTRRRLPSHGILLNIINVPCPRDVIIPYVAPKIKWVWHPRYK